MQRKQGSPLSGSITEARGFISGRICRGNYDSADYMENADGGKVILVGSSPTFSDSSSYVGLTLTNKQSVDSHIERNLWVIEQMGA